MCQAPGHCGADLLPLKARPAPDPNPGLQLGAPHFRRDLVCPSQKQLPCSLPGKGAVLTSTPWSHPHPQGPFQGSWEGGDKQAGTGVSRSNTIVQYHPTSTAEEKAGSTQATTKMTSPRTLYIQAACSTSCRKPSILLVKVGPSVPLPPQLARNPLLWDLLSGH